MCCVIVYFQRGSEELMSHSPMVTTNGTGHSPSQIEVNDAKKVGHTSATYILLIYYFSLIVKLAICLCKSCN